MIKLNKVLIAFLISAVIFSFDVNKSISQVTDYDSNVYKTVTIGEQEWMAENLNVEHYRNGDLIPQVQDKDEWTNLTSGAWCYYDNDTKNGKIYGKLYNWYAVNDKRGLALDGWHIPSDAEWTKLTDYLGGEEVAGGKLKATKLWSSSNKEATNSSGFSALPGGFRFWHGKFDIVGTFGYFWSSSEDNNGNVWNRDLIYNHSNMNRSYGGKGYGLSVRCVKD